MYLWELAANRRVRLSGRTRKSDPHNWLRIDDLHSIHQLLARYQPSVIRDVIWGRQADASAQHLGRDRVGFIAAG